MAVENKIDLKKNRTVLVFLHYFGGSENSWQWLIEELEEEFQCFAINLPGFGGSIPLKEPSLENFSEYILKKVAFFGVKDYILIGHSMGAKIALQIAINDLNENVQQLILVAPSPPGIEPIEDDEKQRMLKHPNLEEAKTTVENITN